MHPLKGRIEIEDRENYTAENSHVSSHIWSKEQKSSAASHVIEPCAQGIAPRWHPPP